MRHGWNIVIFRLSVSGQTGLPGQVNDPMKTENVKIVKLLVVRETEQELRQVAIPDKNQKIFSGFPRMSENEIP